MSGGQQLLIVVIDKLSTGVQSTGVQKKYYSKQLLAEMGLCEEKRWTMAVKELWNVLSGVMVFRTLISPELNIVFLVA